MGLLSTPPAKPNPALLAPVGAYFTDGDQLVEILESDHSGAIGEDLITSNLINIERGQMLSRHAGEEPDWRRVYPAGETPTSQGEPSA